MRQDERGTLGSFDDTGYSEGLSAPGYAEQNLVLNSIAKPADECIDSLRLIPLGLVI